MEKLTIKEQYEYFEETFDKFNTTLLDQTVSVGVWEKYNEETIELLEITDFSDNKYIFQKKYDESGLYELIFNQMEKIYIPKEVFTSSTGYFYIAIIHFSLYDDEWVDSGTVCNRIKYELLEDNEVELQVVRIS